MSSEPGRNEPCPCGSGKKWKRCCRGLPLPTRALLTPEARLLERFAYLVAAIQDDAIRRYGASTLALWTAALRPSGEASELGIFAEFTAFHAVTESGTTLAEEYALRHLLSSETVRLLRAASNEPYSIYRFTGVAERGAVGLRDLLTGSFRQVRSDGRLDGRVGDAWLYAKVLTHDAETVLLSCWPLLLEQAPAEAVVRRYLAGRRRVRPSTLLKPAQSHPLYLSWSLLAGALSGLRER